MPPEAIPVRPEKVAAVATAIARGFQDNEVWTWVVPDRRRRGRLLVRYHRIAIRHIFAPRGGAWATADAAGGALWLPPAPSLAPADSRWDLVGRLPWIGLAGIRRRQQLARLMSARHPTQPHYYLQAISIDPAHQRRGHGSALMEVMLGRCDAAGMPAHLETLGSNIPFYRRFGFVESDPIQLPGGPSLWPMWRKAAAKRDLAGG